jgi:hypothetical protein
LAAALAAATAAGADSRQDITSVYTNFLLHTGALARRLRARQRRQTDPLSMNASYGWQIMLVLTGRDEEADSC